MDADYFLFIQVEVQVFSQLNDAIFTSQTLDDEDY